MYFLFFLIFSFSLAQTSQATPFSTLKNLLGLPEPYIAVVGIYELEQAKSTYAKLLHASKNSQIQGVIVHIDCGGGNPGTSQLIFSEIKKLKKIKPVVVIIENAGLSGAYYLATAADFIIALPSSSVGSIGVIATVPKFKKMKFKDNDKSGEMDIAIYTAGDYKAVASPHTPSTQQEIDCIQQELSILYDIFVTDVAQERKLSLDNVQEWANGRVLMGTQAFRLGLIDALGDFSDAIFKVKELLAERGIKNSQNLEIAEL